MEFSFDAILFNSFLQLIPVRIKVYLIKSLPMKS